ncbi:MAG: hypothetical protein K8R90_10635 [Candidatus Cloacimonetes bacterium]|nr:hypothetical protein [Candidatus Cloacimonadota bacterium]
MKRVAFIIDGQFMREVVFKTKAFYYTAENIHKYCCMHLDKAKEKKYIEYSTMMLNHIRIK